MKGAENHLKKDDQNILLPIDNLAAIATSEMWHGWEKRQERSELDTLSAIAPTVLFGIHIFNLTAAS